MTQVPAITAETPEDNLGWVNTDRGPLVCAKSKKPRGQKVSTTWGGVMCYYNWECNRLVHRAEAISDSLQSFREILNDTDKLSLDLPSVHQWKGTYRRGSNKKHPACDGPFPGVGESVSVAKGNCTGSIGRE